MYEVTYIDKLMKKQKQFETQEDLATWLNLFAQDYNVSKGTQIETIVDDDGNVLLDNNE